MATHPSRSHSSKSAGSSARKRTPHVIGAVAGAVIGGVLGAVVVKKVRQSGGAKRLVPAKVPALAKRAAGAMQGIVDDAKVVAKATAIIAADAALAQVKHAAQQFMTDVASGQPPSPPKLVSPAEAEPPTAATAPNTSNNSPEAAASPAAKSTRRTTAKKRPAAQTRSAKKTATRAKPGADR